MCIQDEAAVTLSEVLGQAKRRKASDMHLLSGHPPLLRVNGSIERASADVLGEEQIMAFLSNVMTADDLTNFNQGNEVDFACSSEGDRLRGNAFRHFNGIGVVLRRLPVMVPTLDVLGVPQIVKRFVHASQGLVLVTGATGSGKTTTAAAMVDCINQECSSHIITIEDPIEVVHSSSRSLITQREVGLHTLTFAHGLRAALREDPDVIFVGEMRDLETIDLALKAAETGHLVISTLHTLGAAKTISRIVDVFPSDAHGQIRSALADALLAVVSQELVETLHGERALLAEVLIATPAVRALIREGRMHQIDNAIQTSSGVGMQSREKALKLLIEKGMLASSWAV